MNAMKKMIVAAAVAVVGFAAVAAEASSSETYSFTYQACLRDEHGDPIKKDGVVQRNQKVTIRLWGDATSAKNPLWARKYAVYTDETGLFNLEVSDSTSDDKGEADGYGTPQYDSLAAALTSRPAGQIYIGLFVEGSAGEIVPRQRLFAVPYAAVANDVRAITKDIAVGGNIQFGTETSGLTLSKDGIKQSGSASSSTFSKVQADVVQANTISITGNATMEKDATVKGNLKVNGTITDAVAEVVPVPVGGIIMWTKDELPKPAGHWAICDGNNGTPDLRGRFIVGASRNSGEKGDGVDISYLYGNKGGTNSVRLADNWLDWGRMPYHWHTFFYECVKLKSSALADTKWNNSDPWVVVDIDNYRMSGSWATSEVHQPAVQASGGVLTDVPDEHVSDYHENRPPYYALYYIMRVK